MKEDQEQSGGALILSANRTLVTTSSQLVSRGLNDLLERQSRPSSPTIRTEPDPWEELRPEDLRLDIEINVLGMEFIPIPAGTFMMGSDLKENEGPVHEVTIAELFYMGRFPITQSQWQEIMGYNPSKAVGEDKPVHCVSWDDVLEFISKLNLLDVPFLDEWTGEPRPNRKFKYRLPSEAEWEYACRAGTTGDYAGDLDSMAWYGGVDLEPVGRKRANAFGLFDMHGGVLEWCEDRYHENYKGAPADGTPWLSGGKIATEMNRVARGGSFGSVGSYCRSATRNGRAPSSRGIVLGVRLVATKK